ncbi:unnamed protein product [Strongylus vulgaris]|uniref:Uncharacterized protein n=1 Tax=Strongylus vulgaris TaxID=40348 RepID=A0A3P7JIR6_STRVU|nr:unnamed protein product [Strongylus vulgaris]
MLTLLQVGLLVALGAVAQVSAECCAPGDQSDFCVVFNMLSPIEQAEVMSYLVQPLVENQGKIRKNSGAFGKKGSDPNFLRFGRNQPNFLRFGKASGDPNFLRFGKLAISAVV